MGNYPFQPCEKVCQFQAKYILDNERVQNDYYVHSAAGWTVNKMLEVCDAIIAWETADAYAQRSTAAALISVKATDLSSQSSLAVERVCNPSITGTLQNPLPGNVTWAIKMQVPRRGRGINGRIFWIGLAGGQISGDEMTNGASTSIINIVGALRGTIEGLTSDTYQMGVVHRVIAGVRPPTATFEHMNNWGYSDLSLDTQKLRLPNHKKAKKRIAP